MFGGFSSPAGDGNAAAGEPWRGLGFGACETFHIGGGEAWDGQRECGALTGWATPVAQARHSDWGRAGPGTTWTGRVVPPYSCRFLYIFR